MQSFTAPLKIIGVNPYVEVPLAVLEHLFILSGKNKSPIPIKGYVNKMAYNQTLVRYAGEWRLYINLQMLKDSPKRIGETLQISVTYDAADRTIPMNALFQQALESDDVAKNTYDSLPPYIKHEINRYFFMLKTDASVQKNIKRAINFLHGKERFVGRDPLTKTDN